MYETMRCQRSIFPMTGLDETIHAGNCFNTRVVCAEEIAGPDVLSTFSAFEPHAGFGRTIRRVY